VVTGVPYKCFINPSLNPAALISYFIGHLQTLHFLITYRACNLRADPFVNCYGKLLTRSQQALSLPVTAHGKDYP
jgi:hypothetical protein